MASNYKLRVNLSGFNQNLCDYFFLAENNSISPWRPSGVDFRRRLLVLNLIPRPDEKTSSKFSPDDQHVSLTLALLPIKGRDVREP